eukprot:403336636
MATYTSQPAKLFARQVLRTNVYSRPNPSLFFVPGLNTKPYYDNHSQFGFVKDFEQNYETIKKEYLALKESYGDQDDYKKIQNEHTLNKGGWSWMNYVSKGQKVNQEQFKKHCPVTTDLLENSIRQSGHRLMTHTPFSYSFFSTMKPGTQISPHYGATNIKLRCHFPIIIPDEAFLSVAGDPRPWKEGKMTIFDDSYEHEAANLSKTSERVLLLIDIWHPELHDEEVDQIKSMFLQIEEMIKKRQQQAQQSAKQS